MSHDPINKERLERDLGTKYAIFIVSRGRVDNVRTYQESLPDFLKEHVYIVCPPEEVEGHQEYGRKAIGFEHDNVWQSYTHIIHDLGPSMGLERVLIMDDDVKFFRRIDDTAWNVRQIEDDDFYDMLARLDDECTPDAPLAGLHARQMLNQTWPDVKFTAVRQTMIHFIHVPTFQELNIRPDVMRYKGDFLTVLSVLASGRRNTILCDFSLDQYGASNAPGGVSLYRNIDDLEAAAYKLKELFPDFVTLARKKNIWPGFDRPHLDVRVQWKECWKAGHYERFGELPEGYQRVSLSEQEHTSKLFSSAPKPEGFL